MTGKLISICPELCFPLAGFMMQNIPESSIIDNSKQNTGIPKMPKNIIKLVCSDIAPAGFANFTEPL